jgi:hypothetical protein
MVMIQEKESPERAKSCQGDKCPMLFWSWINGNLSFPIICPLELEAGMILSTVPPQRGTVINIVQGTML